MWRVFASIFLIVLGLYCTLGRSIGTGYDNLRSNATIKATGAGKIYSMCGNTEDDKKRVIVKDIKILPTQPVKGQNLKIDVDLMLYEEVTSGQVKVNLNYGQIPIVDETLDLCDLIAQINLQCPLKARKEVKMSSSRALPDYIPSGEYSGKGIMTDQNGKELLCFALKFNL